MSLNKGVMQVPFIPDGELQGDVRSIHSPKNISSLFFFSFFVRGFMTRRLIKKKKERKVLTQYCVCFTCAVSNFDSDLLVRRIKVLGDSQLCCTTNEIMFTVQVQKKKKNVTVVRQLGKLSPVSRFQKVAHLTLIYFAPPNYVFLKNQVGLI